MKRLIYLMTIVVIISSLSGCYITPLVGYPKGNWVSEDGFIHINFQTDSDDIYDIYSSVIEIPDKEPIIVAFFFSYYDRALMGLSALDEIEEDEKDGDVGIINGKYKYYPRQKKITWVVYYSEVDYYPVGTEIVLHKIE